MFKIIFAFLIALAVGMIAPVSNVCAAPQIDAVDLHEQRPVVALQAGQEQHAPETRGKAEEKKPHNPLPKPIVFEGGLVSYDPKTKNLTLLINTISVARTWSVQKGAIQVSHYQNNTYLTFTDKQTDRLVSIVVPKEGMPVLVVEEGKKKVLVDFYNNNNWGLTGPLNRSNSQIIKDASGRIQQISGQISDERFSIQVGFGAIIYEGHSAPNKTSWILGNNAVKVQEDEGEYSVSMTHLTTWGGVSSAPPVISIRDGTAFFSFKDKFTGDQITMGGRGLSNSPSFMLVESETRKDVALHVFVPNAPFSTQSFYAPPDKVRIVRGKTGQIQQIIFKPYPPENQRVILNVKTTGIHLRVA